MSESHAAAGVREGDVLAGKYRVDRVLGVGGMGVVVAAHHVELDDRVAIKFLLPEALHNGEAVARFAREAQAAVKIKSEHVARVTDVGRLENGAPYIVMEYLDGLDLSAWLQQRGPLPVPQAVEFVLQACEAIAEAHVLGIVHRDLKPANLFVIRRPDGGLSVKVLDFGIAKRIGAAPSANMTSTKAVMGSPLYMSPEQLTSTKDADARTDVWALGVILYELLSGETPFVAETMPGVMMKITGTEPPPLRARRPEIPAALERVVLTCLAKDRAKRFQTIGDLAVALVDFGPPRARTSVERITGILSASGVSLGAAEAISAPGGLGGSSAGTIAGWNQGTLSGKKSLSAWFAVAGFGGLALIFATWFVFGRDGSSQEPTRSSAASAIPAPVSAPPAAPAESVAAPTASVSAAPASSVSVAPASSVSAAPASSATAAVAAHKAPAAQVKPRPPARKPVGQTPSDGKVDVYDDRK
jgi:serine/threonine-protein kinase